MRLRAFRNRSGDCSRGAVRRTSASNPRCGPGGRASRKSTFASAVLLAFPFGENYAGVLYLKVELVETRAIVSDSRVVGEAIFFPPCTYDENIMASTDSSTTRVSPAPAVDWAR